MFTLPEPPRGCWWPVNHGGVVDTCNRTATSEFSHTCWQHAHSLVDDVVLPYLESGETDYPLVKRVLQSVMARPLAQHEVDNALDAIVAEYAEMLAAEPFDAGFSEVQWARFQRVDRYGRLRHALDELLTKRLARTWGAAA